MQRRLLSKDLGLYQRLILSSEYSPNGRIPVKPLLQSTVCNTCKSNISARFHGFYRVTRRLCCGPWQDVCLSVCLSHTPVFCRNGYTYHETFSVLLFLYQTVWQYSDGDFFDLISNSQSSSWSIAWMRQWGVNNLPKVVRCAAASLPGLEPTILGSQVRRPAA